MDTLRVLDEHTVAYLDLTGSGNETAAHLKADGRLTIMVCRFEGTRTTLVDWAEKKGNDGLAGYRRKNNRVGIDGLPNDTVVG